MNLGNATVVLGPKANQAEDVNLGFGEFRKINQALVKICKSKVLFNDRAHGWGHIVDVAKTAKALAKQYKVEDTALLLAALCHDLYATVSREDHEVHAGQWVREHLASFGYGAYVEVVARMCEQHRASYQGEYSGAMEELFASADRGFFEPANYAEHYWRSFQYNADKYPEFTPLEVCGNVANHMREKFGINGYAKWPIIYSEVFGHTIKDFGVFAETHPTGSDVALMLANHGFLKLVYSK